MKFKVLAAASVLLIGAQSARSEGVSRALDGLSVGAQIGMHTQSSKITQRFNFEPFQHKRKDMGGQGVIGGLNIAYGHIFPNHLFLGAEIKGELTDMGGKISGGFSGSFEERIHLKMTNSYGAALKAGWVISCALPYVRVGILSSKWSSSSQIAAFEQLGGGKKSARRLGLELGIGVEIPLPKAISLCDRLSIGGEYTHAEYQKFSYQNIIHEPDETEEECDCAPFLKASAKPRTNTFMLRLRYRLN